MTGMRDLYGPVDMDETVLVGEGCVLGCPKEARVADAKRGAAPGAGAAVSIGRGSVLMHHVIVYEGVRVGEGCLLDDRVRLGYDTVIGDRTRITHGAYLCDRVEIGSDCRIAGFLCDGTRVGDGSTVMGRLVHEYTHPHEGWWAADEAPPVVAGCSVVGFGAVVVGGVRIGPRSYVAAGAVVTRDVPPEHISTGTNVCTPVADWTGKRLGDLIAAWTTPR